MKRLERSIEIDAPPERVWELVTDFESFPHWNPFIRQADGRPEVGSPLKLRLRLLGNRSLTVRAKIVTVDAPRRLQWFAPAGVPGLMDTERSFDVELRGDGRTRFTQSEVNTGVLTSLVYRLSDLEERILKGYDDLNRAIKARAEQDGPRPVARPAGV